MILTLSPVESLTAVMSGAAATTNPTYMTKWKGEGGFNTPVGSLDGATAVTLVAAPGSGQRDVDVVQVYNGDTAVVTVTFKKVVNGTGTTLFSYAIPVGYTLRWSDDGISVISTTTLSGVGAAAATGNVASESGDGVVHRTVLTLTNVAMTLADATVGGGVKVYDFPAGRILILGAVGTMTFTTTSALASTLNASVTGNWGVGTVTQANGTLATTEQDIIPTTNFTSSATINVAGSTTSAQLTASAQFDGTATAKDLFLNVGIAGATDIDGDATVTASGTIQVTWVNIGDV